MPLRVNPVILLGLIIGVVLSFAISAGAVQMGNSEGVFVPDAQPPTDLLPPMEAQLPMDVQPPMDAQSPIEGTTDVPLEAAFQQRVGGGGAGAALGVGEAQLGKPFALGTDGPDTFSCVGLMRYVLRTTGVDPDAPWVPEAYLSKYAAVDPADLQPGDIVIYPNWATMYAGNGMLLNSNEVEGVVTHTPMEIAGEPLGIVRPY